MLAKPAEQTPLIAAQAVRLLREAGVPAGAVQLLPGTGETVGAALVADARTRAVMFTGSTEVARLINKTLSARLDPDGKPIPLIAETGGQNAMIVDSSALAEQVVADVMQSSFDSAGQRCSALRVLCLQDDVADRTLTMLKGAMHELALGNPDRLSTDVGPVIDAEAKQTIDTHVAAMKDKGHGVTQLPMPDACAHGTFVPPTLIEIGSIDELKREVFGPVLHVVRYRRSQLDKLLEQIRATGYGLTLGIHTRIDETIAHVISNAHVGNIYVNRNVIGAVVGVQPFGGEGLSGTAEGRWRAVSAAPARDASVGPAAFARAGADRGRRGGGRRTRQPGGGAHDAARLADRAARAGAGRALRRLSGPGAGRCDRGADRSDGRAKHGPLPRGTVLCVAATPGGARAQFAAVLATGNRALFAGAAGEALVAALPASLKAHATVRKQADAPFDAVLFEGDSDELQTLVKDVAQRPADRVGAGRVGGRVRERRCGRLRAGTAADGALGEREHGRGGWQCEFDDDRLIILAVRIKHRKRQGDPEAAPFTLVPRRCYATHDEKLAGATFVAVMSLAGTAHADDVKIGYAGPMTGAQAHYGKDMQNGIALAIEDFNATSRRSAASR